MKSSRPKAIWTKHLQSKEQKEQFLKTILASTTCLERMKQIIDREIENTLDFRIVFDSYSGGDWAYKMAHTNGQLETLLEMKRILESVLPKTNKKE